MEIQQLNVFSDEFIMFESVIAINVGNFVFNENDPSANKNDSLRTGSLHIVRIRSSPPYRAIKGLIRRYHDVRHIDAFYNHRDFRRPRRT